ncbi:MAG TPA: MoxR family ATPase [Herpetosiphon sp.]|uniref:ATPase associated with various cellular activities AAA_3 n=1 Tax=Herpetosiphon aurantiacus (strain ATCC 23779 / DSM 785 / 114-95) TaxID=316274 RepID=A9B6K3_HERA2|nr:MoxR family ATPase [Herpetosiphon sp.]ABX02906.1 ATPase associated with various cellular activities AAA_3 [Herpetosiphon aurantiacus DSM 785]MCA0351854.1 MoxR family ATPase [Chloroflexota bacterium]HBW53045.1 MoxR family ATPase [Herpetosiphon sp.]
MQYTERDAEMFRRTAAAIEAEIGKVIVGQRALIRQTLITLIAGGNALLEGVPGLAKTTLIRTLSEAVDCQFSRIQFTPDLMPADIIGTTIIAEDEQGQKEFRFQRGPIFSNLVLADEINRATPKTQSALLEAMQEHTVSVARTSYKLEEPFFVLATQNPLEMEGTYPLPEAQLDRFFFKINVPFPSPQELVEIAQRTTGTDQAKPQKVINGATLIQLQQMARSVPVATHVLSYAARIISATHPDSPLAPEQVKRYVSYGSSPRGMQALILAGKIAALLDGRTNVAFRDLREMATPTLRHRIILSFEGQAEGVNSESIVNSILESIKEEA